MDVDGKRNGLGVILKEEYSKSVVEVKRVSDRVMIVKLEVEGVMINVISAYAPQVGCEMEENEKFWSELDEVVEGNPRNKRLVIWADFYRHVVNRNRGDKKVMGRYGVRVKNVEGQMVVDFAKRMEIAVVNTYFKKKEDHRVTYKSGGRCPQVDYVLCRRCNLMEIGDCKVLAGDSVAKQHRMVDGLRMNLEVKKKRRVRTERSIGGETEGGGLWCEIQGRGQTDRISKEEVRAAIKKIKSGKLIGPDVIPVEAWRCLGEMAVEFLTRLFNRILKGERMPEEWRWSVLVLVFKNKGDVQTCSNYRGIKLISHTMRLWVRIYR
ncbi:hypothetical protein C0J45_4235 [Silurus meridionalis]|nr:hypothetical protein C0J45_4235 [Silurus meridionalis]